MSEEKVSPVTVGEAARRAAEKIYALHVGCQQRDSNFDEGSIAEIIAIELNAVHQPDVQAADVETAFDTWWAARVAEGYQYGRGPLATVKFGFEAGYAAALAASPVQQNADASKEQNTEDKDLEGKPKPTAPCPSSVVIPESISLDADLHAPSDVDRFLFRLADQMCDHLAAGGNDCSDDLPFADWCVVCQARDLLHKYSRLSVPAGSRIWGELVLDADGEAHFICHTKDDDFATTKDALKKFISLLQGQLDNERECPFYPITQDTASASALSQNVPDHGQASHSKNCSAWTMGLNGKQKTCDCRLSESESRDDRSSVPLPSPPDTLRTSVVEDEND